MCGFELTKLIVLLIFQILRHNDVTVTLHWTHKFRFKIRASNLMRKFSTLGLNKSSNKNRTRSFSILFSVIGKLRGSSLTYFSGFLVLYLKLFENIDLMSKKHYFLLLLHLNEADNVIILVT